MKYDRRIITEISNDTHLTRESITAILNRFDKVTRAVIWLGYDVKVRGLFTFRITSKTLRRK